MRAKLVVGTTVCVFLSILVSGCASTTAPRGWLPTPGEAEKEAYGAWISVKYNNGSSEQIADGEFIAVGKESLFVLTQDSLTAIALNQVERGKLTTYDAEHQLLAGWTTVGALTTPSHGWFLMLSFPLWIISGSIATIAHSYAPIEKFPADSWEDLRKYARFPQGLPEGLDRRTMKSKPE